MKIPTKEQCMRMLLDLKVPQNIVEHTLLVNRVAVFLADRLKKAGVEINVELVDRASLLHDLAKPSKTHSADAAKILEGRGYPEIAAVVKVHDFEGTFAEGLGWEQKVVQYADKRCGENNIVSLDERYGSWAKQYGDSKKLGDAREIMKKREEEIFSRLKIRPEQLKGLVK